MDTKEFEKKVQERLNKPTGGADPTMFNGAKQQPKPVDMKEVGRKLYQRLKDNKKIR